MNLENPETRQDLAAKIHIAMDDFSASEGNTQPFRTRLGAGIIENPCSRYLWYSFRWVKPRIVSAISARVFKRGDLEEPRIVEMLEGGGFRVKVKREDGKPFFVSDVNGHFGGGLDGVLEMTLDDVVRRLVAEFKTSKGGAKFNNLVKRGVEVERPLHYGQMCVYGRLMGLEYGVYICACKNDDDLHVEIVKLNIELADQLLQKARTVINATYPPEKISKNSAFFKCKQCDMWGICHNEEPVAMNCRSCINANPIENGDWFCAVYKQTIPKDCIINGCAEHDAVC